MGSERVPGSTPKSKRDDPWAVSPKALLTFVGSLEASLEEGNDSVIMFDVLRFDGVAPNSSKVDEHADVLSLVLPELCEPV